jgi:hypothetical protein
MITPQSDRRRATRVSRGPLRIRLRRGCEGILVDISETGALVQVPASLVAARVVTLDLENDGELLRLPGRIVRSTPQQLHLAAATLARKEYQIALEFSDLPEDQVVALRRLTRTD